MGFFSGLFRPNVEKMKSRGDIEGLARELRHRDWHVRMDAAEALGQLGDERAVPHLIEALRDESHHVRREAAEALGHIGDRRALEPLIRALRNEWGDEDSPILAAIERLGERRAIEPIIRSLRFKSRWMREEVDESLGKIQDAVRAEPVVEVIADRDRNLQWNSDLMRRIGDAREIEPISEALEYETKLSRWREKYSPREGREEAPPGRGEPEMEGQDLAEAEEKRLKEIIRRVKKT